MSMATRVAFWRSPPTPTELSPSKNMRSPASEASEMTMSASRSDFQWNIWSSSGIDDTNPPTSPRRSIVATSIAEC